MVLFDSLRHRPYHREFLGHGVKMTRIIEIRIGKPNGETISFRQVGFKRLRGALEFLLPQGKYQPMLKFESGDIITIKMRRPKYGELKEFISHV
jgi:hypothetical protein